jgi:opacity protein-like surface antigen
MSKKTLITNAIIGIASLGITVPVFANYYYDNGYYAKAPIPVATPSPYAYDPSASAFVFGLEGGYADTHWDNVEVPGMSISSTGFTGRGYIGYEFNRYIGVESGFIYLPDASIDGVDGDISNYAIDVLGKISVPISSGFDIYAKAGIGYFDSSGSGALSGFGGTNIGPAFGVGAGYELRPNLAVNLSWMRYSGNGKIADTDYQPNPDALLLGMSYKLPAGNS